LDETLAQPEMLNRFIWYCFAEAEPDVAVAGAAALVPDPKALRARVVERLKEADVLPKSTAPIKSRRPNYNELARPVPRVATNGSIHRECVDAAAEIQLARAGYEAPW
jgi:hypothetical protein